ncbi:DNA-methyltransferase [Delftia tsuruhatensis]|uniref:DNA-methyltransferase n=1 Tax=Delftia tsuruhatensis TaxID=180282 RepID=UPI0028A7057E|nr:DNA methyltransferase [Delftia tsuruhatensis]
MQYQLEHGDCLEVLGTLADSSVDAIVTDPPYGLSFMGKRWDYDVPGVEVWAECLRVLKPGGHLLAFAGTRTQHRMAVRIEDAGFEIRDMIAWVYGSGFPKSLDVSKAIDKAAGAEREVIGKTVRSANRAAAQDQSGGKSYRLEGESEITAPATDEARQWQGWGTALKPALEPITVARKPLVGTVAANVLRQGTGALNIDGCRVPAETMPPNTGNGGMPRRHEDEQRGQGIVSQPHALGRWPANLIHDGSSEILAAFPDAPGQMADASRSTKPRNSQHIYGALRRGRGDEASANADNAGAVGFSMRPGMRRLDAGSAARFFYCPKASRADRNEGTEELPQRQGGMVSNTSGQHITRRDDYEPPQVGNHHPTVKPTDLMAYLCRLVTPPGGLVLDPFMGSGSTGKACMREGFRFLGIEREAEYLAIARARIEHEARRHGALAAEALPAKAIAAVPEPPERHVPQPKPEPAQRGLF